MSNPGSSKNILIIGAGIAGLSTGIYAQLNGYKSRIFEMHSLPGLKNFYMTGQWVQAGGGLPSSVMNAEVAGFLY